MPSLFARLGRVASGTLDRTYGERVLWAPQVKADVVRDDFRPAGPDPDREGRELRISISLEGDVVRRIGEGANSQLNVERTAGRHLAWIDPALCVEPNGLREGDHLTRLDEPGQPRFRLLAPIPNEGRLIFPLLPA